MDIFTKLDSTKFEQQKKNVPDSTAKNIFPEMITDNCGLPLFFLQKIILNPIKKYPC